MLSTPGPRFPALGLISKLPGMLHPSCCLSLRLSPSTVHDPGKRSSCGFPPADTPVLTSALTHISGVPWNAATASALHLGFQLLSPLYTVLPPARGPWIAGVTLPTPTSLAPNPGWHMEDTQRMARSRLHLGLPAHPSFQPADGAPQVWPSQTPGASACLASITCSSSHSTPVFFGTPPISHTPMHNPGLANKRPLPPGNSDRSGIGLRCMSDQRDSILRHC